MATIFTGSTLSYTLTVRARASDALTDADSLVVVVTRVGDASTTYTYGVGDAIVRESVGLYRITYDAGVAGGWGAVGTAIIGTRRIVMPKNYRIAAP